MKCIVIEKSDVVVHTVFMDQGSWNSIPNRMLPCLNPDGTATPDSIHDAQNPLKLEYVKFMTKKCAQQMQDVSTHQHRLHCDRGTTRGVLYGFQGCKHED